MADRCASRLVAVAWTRSTADDRQDKVARHKQGETPRVEQRLVLGID